MEKTGSRLRTEGEEGKLEESRWKGKEELEKGGCGEKEDPAASRWRERKKMPRAGKGGKGGGRERMGRKEKRAGNRQKRKGKEPMETAHALRRIFFMIS